MADTVNVGTTEDAEGVGRATGARTPEVAAIMAAAVRERVCPLCSPAFEKTNGAHVIQLDRIEPLLWNVWHNLSPLGGAAYHIMLAPKQHVQYSNQLSPEANTELRILIELLRRQYGYSSYSVLVRQGQREFNSATIDHLHWHVIVSSGAPAEHDQIEPEYRMLIKQILGLLPEHPDGPLESVMQLMVALDLWRAAEEGKAVPIRAKLSNKAGSNSSTI